MLLDKARYKAMLIFYSDQQIPVTNNNCW